MSDRRPTIAALVADAFQEEDYFLPKIALNEAGYRVEVVLRKLSKTTGDPARHPRARWSPQAPCGNTRAARQQPAVELVQYRVEVGFSASG